MTHHKGISLVIAATAFATFTFSADTASALGPGNLLGGLGGEVKIEDTVVRKTTKENLQVDKLNLDEQQQQTRLAETQLEAMGQPGGGMSLIGTDAFKGIGSDSDFYQNLEKFGFDMCAINLCQVGDNPQTTTDVNVARDWAKRTFYSSTQMTNDQVNDLKEVRRRAVAYSAANAFAVSTTVHNDLATGGSSAKTLEDFVHSQSSFRGDIQANSAVALAQYKVALQQLAVLTAMLDIQSTTAISNTDLYHEDGGTEQPDAYNEFDFRDDGTRQYVTVPQKGTAN
jgi:hypothetical protein